MAHDKPISAQNDPAVNHSTADSAVSQETVNKRLSYAAGVDDNTVHGLPAAMPSSGPSNVEGYSIYSNIKDGKVRGNPMRLDVVLCYGSQSHYHC
jgi:hypothetical protein